MGGPRNDRMKLWPCYSRLVCDRDQAGTRVTPAGSRPGHRASGKRRGRGIWLPSCGGDSTGLENLARPGLEDPVFRLEASDN